MPLALVARVFDTQANQSFDKTFERFPVRIGRNQLNDLPIDRPYVSQFHAAFDVRERQIFVRDLGSTNGTLYQGRRLARDTPIDVTGAPEIAIGPLVIRVGLVDQSASRPEAKDAGVLDASISSLSLPRQQPIAPGLEDPFVRQLIPYIEAYRAAWGSAYRVIYDHLARLPPELRPNYLKRLGMEQSSVNVEPDFQKIAQYYGVDPRSLGDLSAPQAALAALTELARSLSPGLKPLEDPASVLGFARRIRDSMEVFLNCFVSLRDGYQEFEAEVLARDRNAAQDRVAGAKDAKELGVVLLGPQGPQEDTSRQLQDIFVEVMSHQVALLNGVMEGVKTLLTELAPKKVEEWYDRSKKGGFLSNRYEGLWKEYEKRHGNYDGEDKQTFLIIFGPQFSRAYAATAGEDYKSAAGGDPQNQRFTISPNKKR